MGSLNSNAHIFTDNRRPQVIEKEMCLDRGEIQLCWKEAGEEAAV